MSNPLRNYSSILQIFFLLGDHTYHSCTAQDHTHYTYTVPEVLLGCTIWKNGFPKQFSFQPAVRLPCLIMISDSLGQPVTEMENQTFFCVRFLTCFHVYFLSMTKKKLGKHANMLDCTAQCVCCLIFHMCQITGESSKCIKT